MTCAVVACYEPVKARHLCARHYKVWARGQPLPSHTPVGGRRLGPGEDDAVVCLCRFPHPDSIGECAGCGRLVVTYAHANREQFAAAWPLQWERATRLGLMP